jgi:ABC-2 type transport system permease protein
MTSRRTLATTARVLQQLQHDHRTVALVLFMPSVLITMLHYVYAGNSQLFNGIAPLLLGIIPFTLMFIVASVAVLRERTSGTLERLLTSPATKSDILFGYGAAFTLLAFLQAALASMVTLGLLDVYIQGPAVLLLLVSVLAGILGMSFGLLFSAFAKNEFQAVQFMPAFVLPQFLTCGLFVDRVSMAKGLQYFADIMPITYVVNATKELVSNSGVTATYTCNVVIIFGFILGSLLLGSVTLRNTK